MSAASGIDAMPARRVLAVCYTLPPALYPQAIQIGRLLAHSRHTIGEVCGPPGQQRTGAAARPMGDGMRLVVADDPPRFPHLHRLALRLLPLYGAVPDPYRAWAVRAGTEIETSRWLADFAPEVLVTFGEPMSDHLLGLRLKQQAALPWIAHFSDPWSDNPFRRPHKLAWRVNAGLEAQVVAAADAVIFTSEETTRLFRSKYGPVLAAKSYTLAHSLEPSLYDSPAERSGDALVLRYLGNFYGHRTPVPLLRALRRLGADRSDVADRLKVEFIGSMPGWMSMHPEVRRAPPEKVRFVPPVDYVRSLKLMSDADLLLVIDAPAKQSLFLPSKLIDYLGAGRPVLGVVPPGPSARLIERIGGWIAGPNDTEGIVAALLEFASDSQRRQDIARKAREVAVEFDAVRIASEFDALVDLVARSHRGGMAGGRA